MSEIRIEGLVHVYPGGVRALDGLDLVIPAGDALALVGANGSGKTTLARHLVGLLRPTAGRVLLGGEDIRGRRVAELASQVGLCFGTPERQILERRVLAEVERGPRYLGADPMMATTRARAALEAVGMSDDVDGHPDDLGPSARKLLTVASVLAMQTDVLVLDEPTAGLDERGVDRVRAALMDVHAAGRTVVAISHDLRFVAETFGRVVVLDGGRVTLDGTPAAVFDEAAWPVLRAAGLEPPLAARVGARLGLGSTPTEDALRAALRGPAHRSSRHQGW